MLDKYQIIIIILLQMMSAYVMFSNDLLKLKWSIQYDVL